jgi:hypothetical protein
LLNYGFPIRPSLEIASRDTYVGSDYIVVGDGSFHVTQVQGALPNMCRITRSGDSYRVDYRTYPVGEYGLGSLVRPILDDDVSHYLSSGTADGFEMTESELEDFLDLEEIPVIVDRQLVWSGSLDVDSI